jgi:hypothetical protein
MKAFFSAILGWALCLTASRASSQIAQGRIPGIVQTVFTSREPDPAAEIVRVVDDPATGNRWLLEKDTLHPGWPGRMVLVSGANETRHSAPGFAGQQVNTGGGAPNPATSLSEPVIRAGDRIVVEEHTALLDAKLEAVALSPAREGGVLRVRLAIGGRVMRAVAVGPGSALLAPDQGEHR